jgi:hypothetical protein
MPQGVDGCDCGIAIASANQYRSLNILPKKVSYQPGL